MDTLNPGSKYAQLSFQPTHTTGVQHKHTAPIQERKTDVWGMYHGIRQTEGSRERERESCGALVSLDLNNIHSLPHINGRAEPASAPGLSSVPPAFASARAKTSLSSLSPQSPLSLRARVLASIHHLASKVVTSFFVHGWCPMNKEAVDDRYPTEHIIMARRRHAGGNAMRHFHRLEPPRHHSPKSSQAPPLPHPLISACTLVVGGSSQTNT